MKKFLLSVLICLPLLAKAQTDEKYLAGAIPVVDGKVSFTTEMQVPALSQEQLYDALLDWANTYFKPEGKLNARVLYTNKEEGTIAAGGEEYLVFTSSALSLDRTRIYYQLLMTCKPGKCDLEMTRIRYWYDEARDGGEKYVAEEWITDDMALNKSKTKLAPICGKFRRKTIDLKDELFKSIQSSLGNSFGIATGSCYSDSGCNCGYSGRNRNTIQRCQYTAHGTGSPHSTHRTCCTCCSYCTNDPKH